MVRAKQGTPKRIPKEEPSAVDVVLEVDPRIKSSCRLEGVKTDQEKNLSERSELFFFPFWRPLNGNPAGAAACGRLLLLPFLGEARKGSGCRATPGYQPRS